MIVDILLPASTAGTCWAQLNAVRDRSLPWWSVSMLDERAQRALGAAEYLVKPVSRAMLAALEAVVKVLIVEDNARNLKLVRDVLGTRGLHDARGGRRRGGRRARRASARRT